MSISIKTNGPTHYKDMTISDINRLRLQNQQIITSAFSDPEQLMNYMGAVQAQEYAMAKWALGMRLTDSTENALEQAFNEGRILRTHLMRPTWHFVSPSNIRWLIELTAPRVHVANAFMYRKCELDESVFKKSNKCFTNALEGGKFLTRDKLRTLLEDIGITGDGMRIAYIFMKAELDGLICSGPRKGNQFTYALMDERVKKTVLLTKEEQLLLLSQLYFTSRGPAQVADFVMWSGLTLKEARTGAGLLAKEFEHIFVEGKEYIFKPQTEAVSANSHDTFLMADYDEFGMSYKDRSALSYDREKMAPGKSDRFLFNRMIVVEGRVAGSWQRTIKGSAVHIETDIFVSLSKSQNLEVARAVSRYCAFIGKTRIHL